MALPMMPLPPTSNPNAWRYAILDQTVDLGTGQEWHFNPVYLPGGRQVELAWVGTVRAYANLLEETRYQQIRPTQGPFPFAFGSDRFSASQLYDIQTPGQYRVVVRVGVFNPSGRVRVGLYRL